MRTRGRFVVNFIGNGRSELCLMFASKREDKFAGVSWRPTAAGMPLLADDVLTVHGDAELLRAGRSLGLRRPGDGSKCGGDDAERQEPVHHDPSCTW